MSSTKKIITIDGPAGAGKSTVAKRLAQRLGYSYLDTGAMYRALTLKAIQLAIDMNDESELTKMAADTKLELMYQDGASKVTLDGVDVTEEIRSKEVTDMIGFISNSEPVRAIMVEWQRKYALQENLVVEGRDVGTVVFPQAQYKFYLDADVAERTRRRAKDFSDKGAPIEEAQLKRQIEYRDLNDMTRSTGPLKKADTAVTIDSTQHTIDEVIEKIIEIIYHG